MKLTNIKILSGKIILNSGLHIGAGSDELHIGGIDNPVVKHPYTNEPYIPGSSMKGKLRSLLELSSGLCSKSKANGNIVTQKVLNETLSSQETKLAESIIKLFGSPAEESSNFGPARASFSDAMINNEWKKVAIENGWQLTEAKYENSIDRIKGCATNPRQTERVPRGVEFDFTISFKQFEDDSEDLFNDLLKGLKLLEMDALGGNGSRGYGRIKFSELKVDGRSLENFDDIKAFN